jgi:aprataxin and PNK-like factor
MLPEEELAMQTNKIKRVTLLPSTNYDEFRRIYDFHFRLVESQFLRMCGMEASGYRVTKVEYIINPPLIERYNKFKNNLINNGKIIREL